MNLGERDFRKSFDGPGGRHEFLFSNGDRALVESSNWRTMYASKKIYLRVCSRGRTVLLHRLIAGADRGYFTDHINGDTLDNRRENLRAITPQQNVWNSRYSSRYRGVNKVRDGAYVARVRHNKEMIYLGCYSTPEEAAEVVRERLLQLRPEFTPGAEKCSS